MSSNTGSRVYYGWLIVIAGFFILYVAYGFQYSFGIYLPEIEKALSPGNRADASLGYSIYMSLYAVLGFFSGVLTDRWGPRRVLIIGGILLGTGILLVGQAQTLWQYYLCYILAAFGMCTVFVPATSTTVKWFIKHRGLAVGLVAVGGSIGQITVPFISNWLVANVGWRLAYTYWGIGLAVIIVLFGLLMERGPESKGLKPLGLNESTSKSAVMVEERPSFTLREAMKNPALWFITLGLLLVWSVTFMPSAHLPVFAQGILGASAVQGAFMITTIGIGNSLGRSMGGWISDRLGRRKVLVIAVSVQVFAYLGMLLSSTTNNLALAYASAVLFGLTYGAITVLFAALAGDLFGRRHLSSITGVIFSISGITSGAGPYIAGAIFDRTGNYTITFAIAAILVACAIPLFALIKPPKLKGT